MREDLDFPGSLIDLSEFSLLELGDLDATVLGDELNDLLTQGNEEIDIAVAGFNAIV
ncbi:hypothetical protein [Actinoallomurus soli]|uniref:hypothetical protein n=1 Tax=Actinoallomurus soli TaxID=2952535 RepID=UPI002092EB71|nr:hypothetical protein [Actinoallomurus soli]MCO5973807.1 hypothetical protein [Actinoallomurus soli]